MYDTRNHWVPGLFPSFGILKKIKDTAFRKLDMLPSSDYLGGRHLLSSAQSAVRYLYTCSYMTLVVQ
jgi:hypothetical protein